MAPFNFGETFAQSLNARLARDAEKEAFDKKLQQEAGQFAESMNQKASEFKATMTFNEQKARREQADREKMLEEARKQTQYQHDEAIANRDFRSKSLRAQEADTFQKYFSKITPQEAKEYGVATWSPEQVQASMQNKEFQVPDGMYVDAATMADIRRIQLSKEVTDRANAPINEAKSFSDEYANLPEVGSVTRIGTQATGEKKNKFWDLRTIGEGFMMALDDPSPTNLNRPSRYRKDISDTFEYKASDPLYQGTTPEGKVGLAERINALAELNDKGMSLLSGKGNRNVLPTIVNIRREMLASMQSLPHDIPLPLSRRALSQLNDLASSEARFADTEDQKYQKERRLIEAQITSKKITEEQGKEDLAALALTYRPDNVMERFINLPIQRYSVGTSYNGMKDMTASQ